MPRLCPHGAQSKTCLLKVALCLIRLNLLWVLKEGGIDHFADLAVALQAFRDALRVLAVAAHPQPHTRQSATGMDRSPRS